jgi:hypothetical protein
MIGHAFVSIYSLWTDKSIPLVVCPRSFELDAPVLMKTITDVESSYIQDRWIRGFIRRYVLNSYPRTEADAEPFYTYLQNHSKGAVQTKYEAYLNQIEEIKVRIASGNTLRFYATNSQDVRIRKNANSGEWTVEIDGYLVKNYGGRQERSIKTLRYTVEAGSATRINPDGLYVTDADLEMLTDYVSGKKEGKE